MNEPDVPEYDLEKDLRATDWIVEKVRKSEIYAQNLYAALCNNQFMKNEAWPILADKKWSCSWRYAGGIIADITEQGSYMDWYCSGISALENFNETNPGFVPESKVTEEIESDLMSINWKVLPYTEEE